MSVAWHVHADVAVTNISPQTINIGLKFGHATYNILSTGKILTFRVERTLISP